jgi:nicotinamidase-related amidase
MDRTNGSVSGAMVGPHGLLTPQNSVVALIDYQPQMLFGVTNFDRQSVVNNAVGLAKAARAFDVPVVLSTVETTSYSGYTAPALLAALNHPEPVERTTMNAWEHAEFVAAIERSGRKKLVLGGLWTEACVAFPTIQAIEAGYEVYVVADACGDISQVAHDMAIQRCIQAGAVPMTWIQVMLEWQRDWARRGTYDAVMDIVKQHGGAYGNGVEYAYTMVHGAAPTRYSAYTPPQPARH